MRRGKIDSNSNCFDRGPWEYRGTTLFNVIVVDYYEIELRKVDSKIVDGYNILPNNIRSEENTGFDNSIGRWYSDQTYKGVKI